MSAAESPHGFKQDLDDTDLTKIGRDLHFHPTKNPSPRVLSPAQIEQFNRDGYIAGVEVFDAAGVARNRAFFERARVAEAAAGKDAKVVLLLHLRYGAAWDVMNHPKIVQAVKDLLGENVVGWGAAFFHKPAHDEATVAWHQDASYWPLTPSKVVTVWLAIDDVDAENAAMQFIAGSHHFGHLTYRSSRPDEKNVLNQTIDNPAQHGRLVDDCLKAGQISLHSDLLLHGSGPNRSDRRRCGLTLRYAAAEVTTYHGWNNKGVWVSGRDERGHWANLPRPAID